MNGNHELTPRRRFRSRLSLFWHPKRHPTHRLLLGEGLERRLPLAAPEIALFNGDIFLVDGGILDMGITAPGAAIDKTITVRNTGTSSLAMNSLSGTALGPGFSLAADIGSTTLTPGASTSFTVRLYAEQSDTFSSSLALANNDGDENPFNLNLHGVVTTTPDAIVTILDDGDPATSFTAGWSVSSGVGFRSDTHVAAMGSGSETATWEFRNLPHGIYEMWVTYPAGGARPTNAQYAIYDGSSYIDTHPVNQQIAPNDLNADGASWRNIGTAWIASGTMRVTLNNAVNQSFVAADGVRIQRTGNAPNPNVLTLDDGSSGFAVEGSWSSASGGYENDLRISDAGTGNNLAQWAFNVSPGRYRVSATWYPSSNYATNSPFTVFNGGTLVRTTVVNQRNAPNDLNDGYIFWEDLGTDLNITSSRLIVQLSNATSGRVAADAIRVERLGDAVFAPEISVREGTTELTDGGSFAFGTTAPGTPLDRVFTVQNVGSANLTLTPIDSGSLPAGYTLASNFGNTTLAAGASTSFTLRLQSATAGSFSGALSFNNDDSDENPFNVTLNGTVAAAPVVSILDNGNNGFTTNGEWTLGPGAGYQNDLHYSAKGTGVDIATWTFNVTPGRYQVAATWVPYSNRATDAPYRVYSGTTLLGTFRLNQEAAPNDLNDASVAWERIGTTFDINGTSLVIKLGDDANEYVIADAVRIERAGDIVVAPEVSVREGTTELTDGGSFAFGTTAPGTPLDRVFAVQNVGSANLTLTPIDSGSLPAGYTLVSNFGTTTLTAGASTTFTLRLQSATAGSFNGVLSFNNDDSDENPFNVTLNGTVAVAPVVSILDNGDNGFTASGEWTLGPGAGYQNDLHYSAKGTGADVATWMFNVTPGRYQVAATWVPYSNRATDAPYRVYSGTTLLGTFRLNQEAAPNDLNDASVAWERIGTTFDINGISLVIKLADDANEYVIADAVRIERVGDIVVAPEISVREGTTELTDGGSLAFGTTVPGTPLDKVFTVQNVGSANLTLTPIDSGSLPVGYTLVSNFGNTTLAAGASTTFTLRLQSATAGSFNGALSFSNNDSDENPFNVTLNGTVAAAPVVSILDNGDNGFTTTGEWTLGAGAGYQNDLHYSAKGTGADIATWTFNVTPGRYQVAATWVPYSNRATDAPYRVYSGTTLLGTIRLNQEAAPNDLNDASVAWERIGTTFDINGTSLVIKLGDDANEYVIADAVRIERVGDIVVAPEISVREGTTELTDGGSFAFGTTAPATPLDKVFTVQNVGSANLTLTPIDSGSLPAGYTLVSNFGNTALAAGASTTFTLRLQSATAGSFNGVLSFSNNDSDENPFNVTLNGTVAAAPVVSILDNGDNGFTTTGEWTLGAGAGYQNDLHYSAKGTGADIATWTFNATPGRYQVAATWVPYSNRATDAPYRVYSGTTLLGTFRLNQEAAPNDLNDASVAWERIGTTFDVNGTSLVIKLGDDANEYVIADAVRIERVGDIVVAPEISVREGTTELTDGGSFAFGTTAPATPLDKVFTVQNVGSANLTLTPIDSESLPVGYTLVSNFGTTTLAAGASTTFTLRLQSVTAGSFNGALSFSNNDSDENPFNVTLNGTVAAAPVVSILDNGDNGFTTTGEWTLGAGAGYQNDLHYSAKGTGADVVTWTFNVTPGQYQIATTWVPFSNRATDVPYRVYSGTTLLGTFRLNQEAAPNDLSDASVTWERIGTTFDVNGSSLVIKLGDDANEYVIADAVRIERIGNLPSSSEIAVVSGGTEIIDGGELNLGTTTVSNPIDAIVLIRNDGTGDLGLTPLTPGNLPAGISLVSNLGATSLAPGEQTSFVIRMNADATTTVDGMISLTNTDYDENPYDLRIRGKVVSGTAGLIVVSTPGPLVTNENGSTASFTIVLGSQPSADVVVGLAVTDNSEGTVFPSSLTFTPTNWNGTQTVTVTGKNDQIDDDTITYYVVTNPAVSADPNYQGLNASDVLVRNEDDNDQAGFTVSPASGLVTTESGGTATFSVSLTSEPWAEVRLGIGSSNTAEGVATPTPLIFNRTNWTVPQLVTITGVDDLVSDGPVVYTILTGPATSMDGKYNGLNPVDPSVTNLDNDTAGIVVTATPGARTTESGGTTKIGFVLTSQPTGNVSIPISSSDITEGTVAPASVVFTPANWNVRQDVTVTGVDDPIDDGDMPYQIIIGAAASSDAKYNGLRPLPELGLVNEDNDTAGLIVSPTSGIQVKEGAASSSLTVRLATQPDGDVTVGLLAVPSNQVNLSTSSITFTAGNWSQAQSITVSAVDDVTMDGDVPFTITVSVTATSDPSYSGLTQQATGVALDNEQPQAGILVRNTSGTTYENNATPFTFYVRLNSQPTANVQIRVSVGDATEGELRSASGGPASLVYLTFSAANWSTEQYVNVYGKDDEECDEDITYGISIGPATSADPAYQGLQGAGVSVTNIDSEGPNCQNDVTRFNGGYAGTYTGNVPPGNVAFSVNNGSIVVTAPYGGSGTVNADGQVTFGTVSTETGACSFSGTIVTALDGGANASGTWVCPNVPYFGTASGTWVAQRVSTLLASVLPKIGWSAERLTDEQAVRLAGAAWEAWTAMPGLSGPLPAFPPIDVTNLPDNVLGMVVNQRIVLDFDAAGYGWFIDETPEDSVEFLESRLSTELHGTAASADQFDLLTVLMHEFGHILGMSDATRAEAPGSIMLGDLRPGVRRLLEPACVDAVMEMDW